MQRRKLASLWLCVALTLGAQPSLRLSLQRRLCARVAARELH